MDASRLGRLTQWPAAAQFDVKAIFMGLPLIVGSLEGWSSTDKGYWPCNRVMPTNHVVVIEVSTTAF
jgi:hypothetical protein